MYLPLLSSLSVYSLSQCPRRPRQEETSRPSQCPSFLYYSTKSFTPFHPSFTPPSRRTPCHYLTLLVLDLKLFSSFSRGLRFSSRSSLYLPKGPTKVVVFPDEVVREYGLVKTPQSRCVPTDAEGSVNSLSEAHRDPSSSSSLVPGSRRPWGPRRPSPSLKRTFTEKEKKENPLIGLNKFSLTFRVVSQIIC